MQQQEQARPNETRPVTGPLGYPESLFSRLWDLADFCRFAQVSETKARALLDDPTAPPRLRLGSQGCDRWNPRQVVLWLHGRDWASDQASDPLADARPNDVSPSPAAPPSAPAGDGGSARVSPLQARPGRRWRAP